MGRRTFIRMTSGMGIPTGADIEAMTPEQFKVFENRLRRAAGRQGLRLVKSRRRDPRSLEYQHYWLVSARLGVVCGGQYGVYVEDIAAYLFGLCLGDEMPQNGP